MKTKILIHESAIRSDEILKFLKGMKNSEFSFVTSLPIERLGELQCIDQLDTIHARVRVKGIIPQQFFDVAIFASSEILLAGDVSKKFPDTKIFLIPGPGEFSSDIARVGNIEGSNWQFIHEYIANKTETKVKVKLDGKQKRKKPSNINRAVAPAIKEREEPENGYEYPESSDTPWGDQD